MNLTVFLDQKLKPKFRDDFLKTIDCLNKRSIKTKIIDKPVFGSGILWNISGNRYLLKLLGWIVIDLPIPCGVDLYNNPILQNLLAIKVNENSKINYFRHEAIVFGNKKALSLAENQIIKLGLINQAKFLPNQDCDVKYFLDLSGNDGQYPDYWQMMAKGSVCLGANDNHFGQLKERSWDKLIKQFVAQIFLANKTK